MAAEKIEAAREYQRNYYYKHRDEIRKKSRSYYLDVTKSFVTRRNTPREFEIPTRNPEIIGGALFDASGNKPAQIFENLPQPEKRKPGRPKLPDELKKPKKPKGPIGRPRKILDPFDKSGNSDNQE